MTQLTLATQHFEMINDLASGKIETLPFMLKDCENSEVQKAAWKQIVPYTSLSAFVPETGDLKYAAHQHFNEQAVTKTTVGFGQGISDVGDLTCTRMEEIEGGMVYHMSMSDLLTSVISKVRGMWQELVGFDPIEKFNIDMHNTVRFTFFSDNDAETSDDFTRVAVSVPLNVTAAQLDEVMDVMVAKDTDALQTKEFVVNAGRILMSFDVSEEATKVIQRIQTEQHMEKWAVQVVSQRLLEYFEVMRRHVTYADIVNAVKANAEAAAKHAQALQEQEQQANLDLQSQEDGEVQDVQVKVPANEPAAN